MMRKGMQRKLFDIYVYVGSDIEKNWSYVKLEIYLDGKYRTLNSICSSLGVIELYYMKTTEMDKGYTTSKTSFRSIKT